MPELLGAWGGGYAGTSGGLGGGMPDFCGLRGGYAGNFVGLGGRIPELLWAQGGYAGSFLG